LLVSLEVSLRHVPQSKRNQQSLYGIVEFLERESGSVFIWVFQYETTLHVHIIPPWIFTRIRIPVRVQQICSLFSLKMNHGLKYHGLKYDYKFEIESFAGIGSVNKSHSERLRKSWV
jgi:hypothetical protein